MMKILTSFFIVFIFVLPLPAQNLVVSSTIENCAIKEYDDDVKIYPQNNSRRTPEELIASLLTCRTMEEYESMVLINADYIRYKEKYDNKPRTWFGSLKYLKSLETDAHIRPTIKTEFSIQDENRAIIQSELVKEKTGRKMKMTFHGTLKDGQWYFLYPDNLMESIGFTFRNVDLSLIRALVSGEKTKDEILNEAIEYTRDENNNFNIQKFYFLLYHGWIRMGKPHFFKYFIEGTL